MSDTTNNGLLHKLLDENKWFREEMEKMKTQHENEKNELKQLYEGQIHTLVTQFDRQQQWSLKLLAQYEGQEWVTKEVERFYNEETKMYSLGALYSFVVTERSRIVKANFLGNHEPENNNNNNNENEKMAYVYAQLHQFLHVVLAKDRRQTLTSADYTQILEQHLFLFGVDNRNENDDPMIHFFENAPGEEGLPYKREFLLFFGAVLRHLTHLRYLDLARCPLFSLLFFTLHYGRPQLPAEEEEQEGEERFVLDRNAVTTWCNNSHLERVTLADQQQPSLDWRHLRYVYQPTLRELSLAGSSVNTLDWLLPNFGKPPTANQSFSLYLNSCRRIRDWTPLGRLRGPWATAWIKDTECPRAVYEPMKADGVNICRE